MFWDRILVKRGRVRNISVATRIAIAIMVVAVGALAVSLIYSDVTRKDLTRATLETRAAAATFAKADELTRYVEALESQVTQLSSSRMTVDAARNFKTAYAELPGADTLSEEQERMLLSLYRDTYLPGLEEARDHPVPLWDVLPVTDPAIYLQTVYFERALVDKTSPIDIEDALDGTSWSATHRTVHPVFRDNALAFGFDDLIIVDPQSGAIVYSVAKRVDFATSLEIGPVSGTALSSLVDTVIRSPEEPSFTMVDFSRYNPDYAAPVAFIGSPILDGDELVGVLVAKISPDEISRITTQHADWEAMRLGETGEIFVVGANGKMRSDSRLFIEHPNEYFASVSATGSLPPELVSGVESAETTVLFQRMDSATHEEAQQANGAMIDSTNYLGRDVFTTLTPVGVPSPGWDLIVQVERDEALVSSVAAERQAAVGVAIFVLVLTFISVIMAGAFIRPILVLSIKLRMLLRPSEDIGSRDELAKEPTRTTKEFAYLTDSVDEMLANLTEHERTAAMVGAERIEIVRRLLPEEVARQVEEGDRSVEQVDNTTVVSVVVRGVSRLMGDDTSEGAIGRLEELIDELDSMAVDEGLRRVKVVGDSWVAVCGLDTPHVDHVARSVRLAIGIAGIHTDSTDNDDGLQVSVGVASGPVSAGLAGSDRLVFDAWGSTVTEASSLARSARPGSVLATESVAERLPPGISGAERFERATSEDIWSIARDPVATEVQP